MQSTHNLKYATIGGSYNFTFETWREYLAIEISEHEAEGHPTGYAYQIAMRLVPEDFPNQEPWQTVCMLISACTVSHPDFIIQPFDLRDNEIGFVPVSRHGMTLCVKFCGPGAVGFKTERQAMHQFIERIQEQDGHIQFARG